MKLAYRIGRIKKVPFLDAFESVAPPEFEFPSRLPVHIVCLLPDHEEKSGSFYLQHGRWHCFGCGRGGDVIDFVQESNACTLKEALTLVERALGLEEDEDELSVLVAQARSMGHPGGPKVSVWIASIGEVEEEFFQLVRPFLRCPDPVVSGIAWSRAEYVFEVLDSATAGDRSPPRTERRLREEVRSLWRFALGWLRGVEGDVLRTTGKDRLDAALQGPWPLR